MTSPCRITVIAPSRRLDESVPERLQALIARHYGPDRIRLSFHPQCFASDGHFAGSDALRAQALMDVAADPDVDAVWLARGGYGAARVGFEVVDRLPASARTKSWMGYSDGGALLGGLYQAGCTQVFHGPMPQDIMREDGTTAVSRALGWLVDRSPEALEPSVEPGQKYAAFNLTVLAHLLATPLMPDLEGHVVMLEEVGEYDYRIDRALAQVCAALAPTAMAGIRIGRCSDIPVNDVAFGLSAEAIAEHWCRRFGVPFLGSADIGHDVCNHVVPFGKMDDLHSLV